MNCKKAKWRAGSASADGYISWPSENPLSLSWGSRLARFTLTRLGVLLLVGEPPPVPPASAETLGQGAAQGRYGEDSSAATANPIGMAKRSKSSGSSANNMAATSASPNAAG